MLERSASSSTQLPTSAPLALFLLYPVNIPVSYCVLGIEATELLVV